MAARGVGRVSESQVIWLLFIVLIYVRHQLGGARGGGFGIDTADPCHGLKTMAPTQAHNPMACVQNPDHRLVRKMHLRAHPPVMSRTERKENKFSASAERKENMCSASASPGRDTYRHTGREAKTAQNRDHGNADGAHA